MAEAPDAGVAAHYGDPYREQRALAAGSAAVDLSHRPVVRIAGPDRLDWLHNLTTQQMLGLAPGHWIEALILSPHGHVEHHLQLVDDADAVWAHIEPGTVEPLLDYLTKMRFMSRVDVEDVSADWAVMHSAGTDRLVSRTELSSYEGDLAGVWAYEALRVAARRPRLGVDTDHRTIPNEVGWLVRAVHLDKGCYRGQETVARVYNLGRPPRRLALLHLDGSESELPATGEAVTYDGRDIGRIGTAVRHYELGPLALALVKRQVPDEAELVVGTTAARIDPAPDEEPVSPARAAAAARSLLPRRR
jgi:folate-binding protein YgfZ